MSGRLLDFKNYVGGSDNVQVIELFTDTQQSYTYNFGTDITDYTFTVDYQTLVVDTLTYERTTGLPSFSNSSVVGYFANVTGGAGLITNKNNAEGTVSITIPEDRYTGQLLPNARANVPVTVLSVNWADAALTNPDQQAHRWAILERYKPGTSTLGDPTLDSNFLTFSTGQIATFTDNSSTDVNRLEGVYTAVTGLSSGNGVEAEFSVTVTDTGVTNVDITARGKSYKVGETIELLDADLGGAGGADITVTVASVS